VFEMDVKEIRVLLLGQDPYHGPNQAHGLSFSVPSGVSIPPSLRNIYKELEIEYPERNYKFDSGNLENWFYREKIFLLNASLSVKRGKPGSMMDIWEDFTNDVIKFVSENNEKCVFLLLGAFAKAKGFYVKDKNKIVKGVHPSPLAAHNGFFNSNIFKEVELKLGEIINWSLDLSLKG
jgi:uracil-DNA glycosylase